MPTSKPDPSCVPWPARVPIQTLLEIANIHDGFIFPSLTCLAAVLAPWPNRGGTLYSCNLHIVPAVIFQALPKAQPSTTSTQGCTSDWVTAGSSAKEPGNGTQLDVGFAAGAICLARLDAAEAGDRLPAKRGRHSDPADRRAEGPLTTASEQFKVGQLDAHDVYNERC